MPITLTDSEQAFADSPKGRHLIARARRDHDMREAHRGLQARPFTDAMEAEAARSVASQEARNTVATHARDAALPAETANARAARDTAHVMRKDQIANAWRNPR